MGKGHVTDSEGVIDEPGDLGSNNSIFRPSSLGLGKESSFSELQRLVDSMILETDKENLSLSAEKAEHLASMSGSRLVGCFHLFGLIPTLTPALYMHPLSHTFL